MSRFKIVLTVALAFALAACGGTPVTSGEPGPAGPGFPVRIEHKYGVTEIPSAPLKVVTLGLSDHDAVLALGIKPVGAIDWFGERPYGVWPWASPLWAGFEPEIVGNREDYRYEKIIGLEPDLIISLYTGMKKEQYETLSKIAPTVAQSGKVADYAMTWEDMTMVTGRALGKEAQAKTLVDGINARFAAARQAHPEFAGKGVAVVDSFQPGQYAVFPPFDPKVKFMTALGFQVPPSIVTLVGNQNAAMISSEQVDVLEVDRLIWLCADPTAETRVKADQLYAKLKVASEGRALFVPYTTPPIGAAFSFNTVLSIPYALDNALPLLAGIK
jgi:iron complex transport system substrate-binding protein